MGNDKVIPLQPQLHAFTKSERKVLNKWSDFIEAQCGLDAEIIYRKYGFTDEGEAWFVVSVDTPEGVNTVCAISIETIDNVKSYVYFSGAHQIHVQDNTLLGVISKQAPDIFFREFATELHPEKPEGGFTNVVQFISAS